MKDIEIFTGPGCTHCEQAKSLLRKHNLDYLERDVSAPGIIDEFRERLPRSKALPQIFADGKHLGSLEDLQIRLKKEV
ncbi:MAG: glutaredoxin [Gammaproteobacteria bacterium]|nr:glutaredoxin [Gammaproteobacteria bacterium]MDH3538002.1 glutaredoxin [Gammaproteobacteria bacterium]